MGDRPATRDVAFAASREVAGPPPSGPDVADPLTVDCWTLNAERKPHITAVVLAAGASRRMGAANKLLLPLGRTPVVVRVVEAVRAASVAEEAIVVTGHERAAVEEVLAPYPARCVHNADYASGMASSIRRGVEAASPHADGIVIGLGDMPLVQPETWRRLRIRFAEASRPAIVFPVNGGRRGHPVLFDTTFRDELLQLHGDGGARAVIRAHADAALGVPVDDPGIFRDLDTRAAYEALVRAVNSER